MMRCALHIASRLRQHGSFAVEAALTMPILMGIGFISTDMHRIGIVRSELEQHAGAAALTLAMQPTLTEAGLNALEAISIQDNPAQHQLVILNVLQSGKLNWGFKRGATENLCSIPVAGGYYTGQLPEALPAADSKTSTDNSTFSYIIVQQCRSTSDITLAGKVGWVNTLQVIDIQRAASLKPTLDTFLTRENRSTGLAETTTESSS